MSLYEKERGIMSYSTKKREGFSTKIGYILSVAGASVGLGNIWRFPYLAAKHGGAIFLLIYLLLMLTFGYALIISETALGRMTKKDPVGTFKHFSGNSGLLVGGWINSVIPLLIVPYYCVIGGWVLKYTFEYLRMNGKALADDAYFTSFISNTSSISLWFIIFSLSVLAVVAFGVQKGIEKVSKFVMPVLLLLAVIISIYSMSLEGAIEGVKYFLIPNIKNFSFQTIVAAMGQMFYSLSIAMGILITYGSYMNDHMDIEKSTKQVEYFDTAVAVLAGLMIIPAVFAFSNGDMNALQAGPSLMFITLPKVFAGVRFGLIGGLLFFILVFFAAQTSAIALAETVISTFRDQFGYSRRKSVIITGIIILFLGLLSAFGFNILSFIHIGGLGILDMFDFLTNSILMPIAAFYICLLIYHRVHFKGIEEELTKSGAFKGKKIYIFTMKYLAPVCLLIILISSIVNLFMS